MSTLSSANVTDVNLVLKERTHMRLCLNMLIFTHNLGNWLIELCFIVTYCVLPVSVSTSITCIVHLCVCVCVCERVLCQFDV